MCLMRVSCFADIRQRFVCRADETVCISNPFATQECETLTLLRIDGFLDGEVDTIQHEPYLLLPGGVTLRVERVRETEGQPERQKSSPGYRIKNKHGAVTAR